MIDRVTRIHVKMYKMLYRKKLKVILLKLFSLCKGIYSKFKVLRCYFGIFPELDVREPVRVQLSVNVA